MFAIVLGILLIIVGIIFSFLLKKSWISFVGVMLALVILVLSCIAIVPTGYTGILTTFGRVENRTIGAGINFIAPWQSIVKMDNRTQKVQIQTSAFSSDIQQVDLLLAVNYCIDQSTAQELYKTVGTNYYSMPVCHHLNPAKCGHRKNNCRHAPI